MNPFVQGLLDWYEANRRYLPWREENTPYRVFLSEIMLQQTRVSSAIPYFERFVEAYPSFQHLASAEEEDVLRLWQGLGYYSRARNLLCAAKIVVERHNGELPKDLDCLKALPGVGDYVSRAVLSIAFDEPFVAVDGNLMRVYARLEAKAVEPSDPKAKKECAAYLEERIESPSRFNQALMDLGELVCLPHGAPLCVSCPFASLCKAHRMGKEEAYPLLKRKNAPKREDVTVLLAVSHGSVAVKTRPQEGLLASMHEFPNRPGKLSAEELTKEFPSVSGIRYLGKATHRFSHRLWDMYVYVGEGVAQGCDSIPLEEIKTRCALPTAFVKALKLLD